MTGASYDLKASVPDPDGDRICCDVEAEPVPPICKIQIKPIYREYYGVAMICLY